MEPPVAASGPMLRRAATFSHRTERALKDVNGRVGLLNKSQEHLSKSKTGVDGQKAMRPGKQYSAVASRYAAPLVSKKQLSTVGDGPHGGHANVTKLPFITGRSAPQHKRRPSSDNLSSFQPPMVFSASARDPKPDTLAKKADVVINTVSAKRPRVAKRTSMIEKKPQVQTRPPRFYSLDKGRSSCSKNGTVRGSVDVSETGSASLLYSAAHWVSLIKLAEGEKKLDVVIDLFRLAIKLKAEPTKDVVGQLKRYQESYPGDEVVIQLVEQCECTQQEMCSSNVEVIDKSVCEAEEAKRTASEPGGDVLDVPSESKNVIVPAVVSGNEAAMKKDVPHKPPHFMGRMLSRSSTFSCVDAKSQSQHAKAEYGKKLVKTMEFVAVQAGTHSPSKTGDLAEISPCKIQNVPLACVPEVERICKSTTTSEVQATPSFGVASKIVELASRVGSKLPAQPASENFGSLVFEAESILMSGQDNGSAEKPVDSLSKWLDGESSEMGSPGVQSSLREDSVDLSPNRETGIVSQCSPSKTQNAPLASAPVVEIFSKSSTTLEVEGQSYVEPSEKLSTPVPSLRTPSVIPDDQATPGFKVASNNVELASKVGSEYVAVPTLLNYSSPVSEVGSTRESAVCNGDAENPVDSLSEWLDGDSSEMGTPEIQSALSEETVDLSPDRMRAIKLMDVDSLMREVVSHFLPDDIPNSPADSKVAELNGRSSAHEFQTGGNNWPDAGEQSMTEIVENISRSHRLSVSVEADLPRIRGSGEEMVKLFTELAEVRGATPWPAEPSDPGSASKERHDAEVLRDIKIDAPGTASTADISAETDSALNIPTETESAVDPPVETVSDVKISVETESDTEIPVKTDARVMQNKGSNVSLATPLRMLTKQKSMKGDTATPYIPATPSAATPSEPASAGILRARHRRASSVGTMTPRGPFDMTGECSPFGDSSSSPSGQSSSVKSKRLSRGYKEVTPRFNLPKPSWKAIVEREMKGSKLKDLLAAELPEETSPLAEYVQSQMENQTRDLEIGSTGTKEKDAPSTCSPSKRVTKMALSSSKKRPALKESQQEGANELSTAQKLRTLNEGEQEMGAGITGCPTPGSAVRRSARIQSKVQSRRNMLFKDEFAYL